MRLVLARKAVRVAEGDTVEAEVAGRALGRQAWNITESY